MIPTEEKAAYLLRSFTMDDEQRAALVKRLGQAIDLADLWKAGKAFHTPPSGKTADTDLRQLAGALGKVREKLESIDPDVLSAINRPIIEGDIPLLDSIAAGSGRTDASQRIAEVLYGLSGRLLDHIATIHPAKGIGGKDDDFTRFLAIELATVYKFATGEKATRRTDWASGESYGPFLEFVSNVISTLALDLSPETIVKKASDPSTYSTPIRLHSALPVKH